MILSRMQATLRGKGYKVYSRPYELNIVGMRSGQSKANSFDDEVHVFFNTAANKTEYHIFKATTDPGTYWLENPSSPQGTAILAEGQYPGAYQLGLHKGQYKALVQRGPVNVIRDYDRNAILDFTGTKIRGIFGINLHRAMVSGTTRYIDKWSAGCQVFATVSAYNRFMEMCEKHRSLYGNSFTYTLIDFRALKRTLRRRMLLTSLLLISAGLGVVHLYNPETTTET